MKRILIVILHSLITLFVGAATHDADGMPIFYLLGSQNNWKAADAYKFNRQGQEYSLHLDNLNGEFKISVDGWSLNFGSPNHEKYDITGSEYVTAKNNTANFRASLLSDVNISFRYDASISTQIEINFTVGGAAPIRHNDWSGTLPVLHINVYDADGRLDDEVISKDLAHKNYFSGTYWLELPDGADISDASEAIGSEAEPLPLEIKARGNWTRIGFAKKPFKLKLGSKQPLLGLSKSKHFALLAHADDANGYLKNYVGFNLGQRIGLPWTPDQRPVEVVINGDYRGLYFLTESIRIEKDRVNIAELDDLSSDPTLASGGYLVELDNYDEENQIRMDEKGCIDGYRDKLRITFDTPEQYSDLQLRFITEQFSAINDCIGANSNDTWAYLDLDDAARYYLVEEIIGHVEAFHGSTYLFRDRGEGQKWHFSPLWDCGNAFRAPADDYFYRHAPYGTTWVASLRENAMFNQKVMQTWQWFMGNKMEGINADIDRWADALTQAAAADRRRWKDAPVPNGGAPVADNTDMTAKADAVKQYLHARIAWLTTQFGQYSADCTEPQRDATPAAPLPDYLIATHIDTPDADGQDTVIIYYNLQGIRVDHPTSGIYIMYSGGTAHKVVF